MQMGAKALAVVRNAPHRGTAIHMAALRTAKVLAAERNAQAPTGGIIIDPGVHRTAKATPVAQNAMGANVHRTARAMTVARVASAPTVQEGAWATGVAPAASEPTAQPAASHTRRKDSAV